MVFMKFSPNKQPSPLCCGLYIGQVTPLWVIASSQWLVAASNLFFKKENHTHNNLFEKATYWDIMICFLAAEQ